MIKDPNKILIVRFSSFGDIIQCLSVVAPLRKKFPNAKVDWLTKAEFTELLKVSGEIDRLYHLDKRDGLRGLFEIAKTIRTENYDIIYDAHNNLRSHILRFFLIGAPFGRWVFRFKDRFKRVLLFTFRINLFPKPFKGMLSYLRPLSFLGIKEEIIPVKPNFSYEVCEKILKYHLPEKFITLVPSAAWPMKRWPLDHWKKLILMRPDDYFVVLGGPHDDFCDELVKIAPERVKNLAGELSLIQSAHLVERSRLIISADTGLLHVADLFGKKGIALIGPTAFGFTSGKTITTLEVDLPCRPCSKDGSGKCSQKIYQRCMVEITPEMLSQTINKMLA